MKNKSEPSRFFWGLLLIIIGLLFLGEQVGYIDFGRVISTYWPAIFILIGISIYLGRGFKRSGAALFLMLLGTFLLLVKLQVIERYLWKYFWPGLLILAGFWLILKAGHKEK
jgi:hypothetical protein